MSTTSVAEAVEGPRTLAPLGRRLCRVTGRDEVGPYVLLAAADPDGPAPAPGQFYMLSAAEGWGGESGRPHLGRAFSVCRARDGHLEFLLEAIGPGTARLAELGEGDHLALVGPLGIGFTHPPEGSRALLVGGGIGIAPLVIWAEALTGPGLSSPVSSPLSLLGFRNGEYAEAAGLFPGHVLVATDDGTGPSAYHGLVTDLLERELAAADVIYACGPHPMLKAVRRICVARGIEAQLALEAGMACGFGACFGCVVATRTGFRRLCVDGPVVRAAELAEDWQ
jgi:dihydroorotate dehydrogenase electron transfer subunit